MFFTSIAALFGAACGISKANERITRANVMRANDEFDKCYRSFTSSVEDHRLEREMKTTIKKSDFWKYLGRDPRQEESNVLDSTWFIISNPHIALAMSEQGKLPFYYSFGFECTSRDPVVRRLIAECMMVLESNLRKNGIRTAACVRSDSSIGYLHFKLSDCFEQKGMDCVSYGDRLFWANTNPATLQYIPSE